LLAVARDAGSDLARAHGAAELLALGFRQRWGYRKLEGQNAAQSDREAEPASRERAEPLSADEESAAL